jgi:hypothetical protein
MDYNKTLTGYSKRITKGGRQVRRYGTFERYWAAEREGFVPLRTRTVLRREAQMAFEAALPPDGSVQDIIDNTVCSGFSDGVDHDWTIP